MLPRRRASTTEIRRRDFLKTGGAATLACVSGLGATASVQANPLGLPLGLQLWTVKEDLDASPGRTLDQIASIGYRELELFQAPPDLKAFRKQVADAGLKTVGSHVELYMLQDPKTLEFASALGMSYLIIVFPTLRQSGGHNLSNTKWADLVNQYETIALDDYKWNAEQLNKYGTVLKKQGLQLGYHNHAIDLKKFGDVVALDLLIQSTDPSLVKFELDCGHVVHAGYDPIAFLKRYPQRFGMLHLKDLKRGFTLSNSLDTENMGTNTHLGGGVMNWPELFAAAKQTSVKHLFVEHEGTMEKPHMEEIRLTYNYLHAMA